MLMPQHPKHYRETDQCLFHKSVGLNMEKARNTLFIEIYSIEIHTLFLSTYFIEIPQNTTKYKLKKSRTYQNVFDLITEIE